jgi:hypothetical protein
MMTKSCQVGNPGSELWDKGNISKPVAYRLHIMQGIGENLKELTGTTLVYFN